MALYSRKHSVTQLNIQPYDSTCLFTIQHSRRQRPEYNIDEVKAYIQTIINGHGSLQGYSMAQTATQRGQDTTRRCTRTSCRNGPEATEARKGHSWGGGFITTQVQMTVDDKPIHGCSDGWSRKIMWLYVTRSHNQPNNMVAYFRNADEEWVNERNYFLLQRDWNPRLLRCRCSALTN